MVENGLLALILVVSTPVLVCFAFHAVIRIERRRVTKAVAIPKEIQDEIDQTPEWWDREFRKLSGEPEPHQWGISTADALSAIEKMHSPSVWSSHDLSIDLRGLSESVTAARFGAIRKQRPERMTKFLAEYGLEAKDIAEDGWNSLGYWFLTDEWEYVDVHTYAQAEPVLEPTYRVREWREWPEGFDYEGMVRAWNGR